MSRLIRWLAGVGKFYFVKISLPFRVMRKLYSLFLILMHDDDLAVALKKVVAFDARFWASRSGRDRAARSFHRIIHKYLSHRFS
jgi:hypothetical protein